MIACALMLEPALLIADEPTTALDVTTQAQILELIRDLQAKRGTAVLFITHDFGVVSQTADRVAVMQLGEIVEAGAAAEVLGHPRHDYTRKLIAAIPHGMPDTAREAARQPVLLDVRDLHKTYVSGGGLFRRGRETAAMRGISFTLQRGEVLGLVGESGSGKSTLGRCIAGLLAPDGGQILFNGQVGNARPRRDVCKWCSRTRRPRSTRAIPWAARSWPARWRRAWRRNAPAPGRRNYCSWSA